MSTYVPRNFFYVSFSRMHHTWTFASSIRLERTFDLIYVREPPTIQSAINAKPCRDGVARKIDIKRAIFLLGATKTSIKLEKLHFQRVRCPINLSKTNKEIYKMFDYYIFHTTNYLLYVCVCT